VRSIHFVPVTATEVIYSLPPESWPASKTEFSRGFAEWLHWNRWREPYWLSLQKSETGDMEAYGKHERTARDFQRIRFGKRPIKPAKSDPHHFDLFEIGIGLGLESLRPAELACCFDILCPCGHAHNAEALVKQRGRMEREIRKAFEAATRGGNIGTHLEGP
jgi:hypothetical protein